MKKKTGRATASSGSKATDVVAPGYTCCYFLSIRELLCHSFKPVLHCLNLNAVLGIFKVMLILPIYCIFPHGLFFFFLLNTVILSIQDRWGLLSVATPDGCAAPWHWWGDTVQEKRLFKINKEQCLSVFIFREVHLLKFPRTHWAFTKYLNRLRGHSILLLILWSFLAADTSTEKQECQQMKAALTSWQMHVITASLDRAHVPLKKVTFCHNNLSLKSLVLKGAYDKSGLPELSAQPFRKSPGLCHSVLPKVCIIKSKIETEFPFLFNSLPLSF